MASFIAFDSSPDPLGDDDPALSSVRPSSTRRISRSAARNHFSTLLSTGNSTSVRSSASRSSPRKQTFELDVGNEVAPQKILVTVEAEADRRKSTTSRRLFDSSSPTRSVSRRREASRGRRRESSTTTMVPLKGLTDDEEEEESIHEESKRRRGRLSGGVNGTPHPRGKKRAGTPLRKTPRQVRSRKNAPESETGLGDDNVLAETDINVSENTPKPRAKPRKTPKRAATPAASSSKPTGRKRGRPRKALMPDEVAMLTSEANAETDPAAPTTNTPAPTKRLSLIEMLSSEAVASTEVTDRFQDRSDFDDHTVQPTSSPSRNTTRTSQSRTEIPESLIIEENSEPMSRSIHEAHDNDFDAVMTDDYMGETHSDDGSEAQAPAGMTYTGGETLANAADFSMINVESLPSFQASFHANQSGIPSEPQDADELGDETNMIISHTLEELRRSTQNDDGEPSHAAVQQTPAGQSSPPHVQSATKSSATRQSGALSRSPSHSPKRPKPLPLSRQVFGKKRAPVDDSFSSIPESVLQAATPGRLPMKPINANTTHEDSGEYDDSFSEIPDEILEAATPRPPRRSAKGLNDTTRNEPSAERQARSASKAANSLTSSRLPTPENTSSSKGSKSSQHGDSEEPQIQRPLPATASDLRYPSSPTAISQHRTANERVDRPQLRLQRAGTPSSPASSPQLPPARADTPQEPKLLEPPAQIRRPSLSPIVRAGRTLQSVMSDQSSPPGHDSSLGSPFRGSAANDSRQSSFAESPRRNSFPSFHAQSVPDVVASLAQSIRSNFSRIGRQPSTPTAAAPIAVAHLEDPFGPDLHQEHAQTETSRRPVFKNSNDNQEAAGPSLASSTRAAPPSDDRMSWVADPSSAVKRPAEPEVSQPSRMSSARLFGRRNSTGSRIMEVEDSEPDRQDEEAVRAQLEEQQLQSQNQDEDDDDQDNNEMQPEESEEDELAAQPNQTEDFTLDMWDIEASRPTPRSTKTLRAEARARRESGTQAQPQVLATEQEQGQEHAQAPQAPRRTKVTSPWRRSQRHLIFRDEVKGLAEIEVDDSPVSEEEGFSMVQQDVPEEEMEKEEVVVVEEEEEEEVQADQEEMQEEITEPSKPSQEEYHGEPLMDVDVEDQGVAPLAEGYSPVPEQSQAQTTKPQTEDYSLIPEQNNNDSSRTQAKPTPAKRGFFSGFDIMSFFSSPAPPPVDAPQPTTVSVQPANAPNVPGPSQPVQNAEPSSPEQPHSALRATGFFPHIRQMAFHPSPERRSNLFSPNPALHSTGTVPDTYEASSSSPPEPQNMAPSSTPDSQYAPPSSTPNAQDFPPIAQKRNFTPLSAQSRNTASLFTPTPNRPEIERPSTPPSQQEDSSGSFEVSDHNQEGEDSMLSNGSEYERVPPREHPSHWDRTLSPTKSALRSPLKPKTPGRVVAFADEAPSSPLAEAQARVGGNQLDEEQSEDGDMIPKFNLAPPIEEEADEMDEMDEEDEEDEEDAPGPPSAQRPRSPDRRPARLDLQRPAPAKAPFEHHFPPTSQTFQPSRSPLPNYALPLPISSTPRRPPSPVHPSQPSLSKTIWTKAHWIRLDSLLQLRRRDPLAFAQQCPLPPKAQRKSAALLGKEVEAQGESLVLEGWCLDVVDAFLFELRGFDSGEVKELATWGAEDRVIWTEEQIAKRVFALVVGEEKRRGGLVTHGMAGGHTKSMREMTPTRRMPRQGVRAGSTS